MSGKRRAGDPALTGKDKGAQRSRRRILDQGFAERSADRAAAKAERTRAAAERAERRISKPPLGKTVVLSRRRAGAPWQTRLAPIEQVIAWETEGSA